MLCNANFVVGLVTFYLFLFGALLQLQTTFPFAVSMLILSPFLICWMVYTILKYGKYGGPELGNDEFGYQDKKKDELGMF